MKKGILIRLFILTFIFSSLTFVSAEANYRIIIDDNASINDTVIAVGLQSELNFLKNLTFNLYKDSEITKADLKNSVAPYIYNDDAIVFVGSNLSVSYVALGVEIQNILNAKFELSNTWVMMSDDIVSDDLRKTMELKNSGGSNNTNNTPVVTLTCPDGFILLNKTGETTNQHFCYSPSKNCEVMYVCTMFGCFIIDGIVNSSECLGGYNSSCIDSDGDNIYSKGNVSGYYYVTRSNYVYYDSCHNETSIVERICVDNLAQITGITNCLDGCFDDACISNNQSNCNGCELDGNCFDFGYRKDGKYCSENRAWVEQKPGNMDCDNNFECDSNVCVDGKCVSGNLIQKIISWFKKMFGGE